MSARGGGGVPWDHRIRVTPDPHTVKEIMESAGRHAALTRWWWLSSRQLDELHAKARNGATPKPAKRTRKPLPVRHRKVDWSQYGIAA